MKKYLGVKIVDAEPMGEAAFINQVKNEFVPQNCLRQKGYKVVHEDGCVSWLPKEVFEKAFRKSNGLSDNFQIKINAATLEWDFLENPNNYDQDLRRFCVEQAAKVVSSSDNSITEIANAIYKWIKGESEE